MVFWSAAFREGGFSASVLWTDGRASSETDDFRLSRVESSIDGVMELSQVKVVTT